MPSLPSALLVASLLAFLMEWSWAFWAVPSMHVRFAASRVRDKAPRWLGGACQRQTSPPTAWIFSTVSVFQDFGCRLSVPGVESADGWPGRRKVRWPRCCGTALRGVIVHNLAASLLGRDFFLRRVGGQLCRNFGERSLRVLGHYHRVSIGGT